MIALFGHKNTFNHFVNTTLFNRFQEKNKNPRTVEALGLGL